MTDESAARTPLAEHAQHRALLQSIVDAARGIFGSKAASVFLLDETTDELVFEAVSGEGEGQLIGMRLPASAGIAGWVLVTRQPLAVDDVASDERFSRSAAESTGYVPNALMAAPLVDEETVLGVLSVLDPPEGTRFGIAEIELLGLFAHQAAIALSLLLQARRARAARADDDSPAAVATRVAAALAGREDDAGRRLLRALEDILEAP